MAADARPYTHAELREVLPRIECSARSGLSLGPEASLRLAATVRVLQGELVQAVTRVDDEVRRREFGVAEVEAL